MGQEAHHRVHPQPLAVNCWVEALMVAALQTRVPLPGWQETVMTQGCLPDCSSLHIHAANVHTFDMGSGIAELALHRLLRYSMPRNECKDGGV